eukprot:TRINITY_DN9425_c1_g1_i1.p1 TRINITY_DN9425_c1_g1~~TRINITY_DN9425_c1_g1_i1.p1  ORF type:complete len:543 (-),score=84.84 TRINITY_DN9425_c1_g1_i1:137-1765(-)
MGSTVSAVSATPRRHPCRLLVTSVAAAACLLIPGNGGFGVAGASAASASTSESSTFRVTSSGTCSDSRWQTLFSALQESYENKEFWEQFHPVIYELTGADNFDWYKVNYQDCVEGLLSLVLYLSLHLGEDRRGPLLELASRTARELNPLALRSGLSTWPLFNLLDKLQLVWQGGSAAPPLLTEPWRLAPVGCRSSHSDLIFPFPSTAEESSRFDVSKSLLDAWGFGDAAGRAATKDLSEKSDLRLARSLQPGEVMVDAGVFDGTDWSVMGILSGATVIGFEPLAENRRLVSERLPIALGDLGLVEESCTDIYHTFLRLEPGEMKPRTSWQEVFRDANSRKTARCDRGKAMGHSYIIGAALGERVRSLNMTTRYDYSSVADQGYLSGPANMQIEQVGMATLDDIFGHYLLKPSALSGQMQRSEERETAKRLNEPALPFIKLLKLDVEGYEMGALRGAERLLSEGRVRFLVLEFHPGMLGSSGTDPHGLLRFLQHYCFKCHSLKIEKPTSFIDFVARYVSSATLPMQGLGELEDLICENKAWRE